MPQSRTSPGMFPGAERSFVVQPLAVSVASSCTGMCLPPAAAPKETNVALACWEHPVPSSRVERGLQPGSGLLFRSFSTRQTS